MSGSVQIQNSWADSFRAFFNRKVIVMLFLGFSAGVPILLVFSTMSIWLSQAGVSRSNIGVFSLVALGYGFKFVWAPLIDKLPLPVLGTLMGHRRSWLLLSQLAIVLAIFLISTTDPKISLYLAAVFAVMLSFSSATQDIIIDAYRIESADTELQGLMSATYIAGYRIGMATAGVGALEIAAAIGTGKGVAYNYAAWSTTYLTMAGVMLVGIITTFAISEPDVKSRKDKNLRSTSDYVRFLGCFMVAVSGFIGTYLLTSDMAVLIKTTMVDDWGMIKRLAGFLVETGRLAGAAAGAGVAGWAFVSAGFVPKSIITVTYMGPFIDFFRRYGRVAFLLLALIATYRIADVVMGVMANVFYVDIGFDIEDIGRITKLFGLIMTIIGGFLGGLLSMRYGVMRILFLGAVLAAGTNLLFVLLAQVGNDTDMLKIVIAADNLSGGIASAAFVAYLSSLTNTAFTASQYAIFSSMMVLLPKVLAGYSGFIVEDVGYEWFFIGTAALGIPVLVLIVLAARLMPKS
jgi:PAT family beta-lactamase induction signal transducer AmpG